MPPKTAAELALEKKFELLRKKKASAGSMCGVCVGVWTAGWRSIKQT